jgi:hypothetical protein
MPGKQVRLVQQRNSDAIALSVLACLNEMVS